MGESQPGPDLQVDFPIPGGLKVTTERPYRILMVADCAGSDKGSVSGALLDGPVELNPDTFSTVMRDAAPAVNYTTADPLLAGSVMTEVRLHFDGLRAFDPAAVSRQLPATRSLMDLRDLLVGRLRGKVAQADLQTEIQQRAGDPAMNWLAEAMKWSPGQPAAESGAVDQLLSQFDIGDGGGEAPPKSPVGALVAAAAGSGSIPAGEASAVRRALAEVDRRVAVWLNAVLHAPPVQALEAAWRSPAFLVSRIEFRKGIRLSLLHAPRAQLSERLIAKVIDPVFDEGADAPDLIVADYSFGNTAPDLEMLDELAQHGASLPAVVFAGVAPGFFGVKQAWQVATLPPLINLMDQFQFAKWKTLRSQAYARSLAVFFGRCLLRAPYERADAADLEFSFREDRAAEKDFLWAGGVLAAACAAARSVANNGWPTAMVGYVYGRVEGFAVAEGGPKGDKKFGPTDAPLAQVKLEELAAVGVNAATSFGDHADALVWNGMTASRPGHLDHDGLLEVSVPYQLFAGRLATLLFALKPHLSSVPADKVVAFVYAHVRDWLQLSGEVPAAELLVQTKPAEDDPKSLQLAVTVTPPAAILPGGVPVVMGYRL